MKFFKKIASLMLAVVMVLSVTATVFAADSGSITINNSASVSVAGKTFNAYKILALSMSADGKAYAYTVPEKLKDFYIDYFNLTEEEQKDVDGAVSKRLSAMTNDSENLFAFATAALAAAKSNGITPGTAAGTADAASVTIGSLPLGYYVVEDTGAATPVSAIILDSTNPNVVVNIKADKPTIDKKIKENTGEEEAAVENNNAAIGDSISFEITSVVPDMTGYEKYYFVVKDTLSGGLTYNDDMVITIGNNTLVKDTDYTVAVTPELPVPGTETVLEIVFKNFIQYKEQKNAAIVIAYSAILNEKAVVGVEGNANTANLIYSNNPNITDNGTSDKPSDKAPVGTTPDETTRTFVTGIELIKTDEAGNRLTGAEFEITGEKLNKVLVQKDTYTEDENGDYWKLKDGSYTMDDPATEGMDQSKYEDTVKKYSKSITTEVITTSEEVKAKAAVGADGVLRFEGLSAGTYTITELKAPAGYNLLKEPITVTIGFTAPENSSDNCTWTYEGTDIVNGTNTNHITIINKAGAELPSTGGMGTTIFYIVGAVLMIGAVVLLITKRRMRSR